MRKNGSRFFASGHTALLRPGDDGDPRGFVKICHDTTMRNDREERMRRKAFHDELTALPNRASFSEKLKQSIALAQHEVATHFAVLYLDLDGFKGVNDSLGHAGGDEFTVLLTNVDTIKDALSVAERIDVALRQPFLLCGQNICISASIGVVVGSSEYERADQVIRNADEAMYRAKARGGAQHALFPALASVRSDAMSK